MPTCQICKNDAIKVLIDCGSQPLCNRFVIDPSMKEFVHPLVLGQCRSCGLIQLTEPVPALEIASRFEWLKYNEPENHLDQLADVICNLPGIDEDSIVFGVTYKDDTLLERLVSKKFSRSWRIDPKGDLGMEYTGAGGETVLPALNTKSACHLVEEQGEADVIIARHAFEHAPYSETFLKAMRKLVKPDGYIVFEVPDCEESLKAYDYSMIWEEHTLYFTQETFQKSLEYMKWQLVNYACYPYPNEDALVAIITPSEKKEQVLPSPGIRNREFEGGDAYSSNFAEYKSKMKNYFKSYKEKKGKIAVFGAGHIACIYINLLGIKDYIEFVIDDHPKKKGLYMPGSRLPIYGSDRLIKENIDLCLLTISPESEAIVIRNNKQFEEQGSKFVSIRSISKKFTEMEF